MKIKLLKACELEVVTSLDETTDDVETSTELIKAGEVLCGDIEADEQDKIDFQFANGSMVYGLSKNMFEVIS